MKPYLDRLAVVTATMNPDRAMPCMDSWATRAAYRWPTVTVWNGRQGAWDGVADYGKDAIVVTEEILGVVPAFAWGVRKALDLPGVEIIACLHDDLLVEEDGWDDQVLSLFDAHPQAGLAGFGGGTGLGSDDIYRAPYSPHQLARQDFVSNLRDAEAHGRRLVRPSRQVACLDGFSQIGRREFWAGWHQRGHVRATRQSSILQEMADWGLVHHAYDSALGCWAARLNWEVWMVPVACHHLGGQTAVGEPRYAAWAETIIPGGDRGFWELAHKEVYERFVDVLPIRVGASAGLRAGRRVLQP